MQVSAWDTYFPTIVRWLGTGGGIFALMMLVNFGLRRLGVKHETATGYALILPWILGNVREKSFREIWSTSAARERFTSLKWGDLSACSECDVAWACTRCPGSALAEAGDLTAESPGDCAVARARAKVSGEGPAGDR